MIDATSSALGGMQRNQEAFARHADRIAHAGLGRAGGDGIDGIDMAQEMVGLLSARSGYEASLPVLRAADKMLGSLLDILA